MNPSPATDHSSSSAGVVPHGEVTSRMAELVERFRLGKHLYQLPSYNETELRVEFLNPLFALLGWDVDNQGHHPPFLREVVHEASVIVEESGTRRKKRPDYEFRVGGERLFFAEAKKPSVDIRNDPVPAFQLRRYGWSANLRFSVLSNFEWLAIYDCSVRPVEGDSAGVALLARFHCSEYVERMSEIQSLLSRESVLHGTEDALSCRRRRPLRMEPFDDYFLGQIEKWRLALGCDLARNNPTADSETIDFAVQRILDRVLFLRFCEDRNLEEFERLKGVQTVEALKAIFSSADRKWDSGLFSMLEEDRLVVSDDVLPGIFRTLYYPDSPYEFGVIDPFVIDQIYEQFLVKSLRIGQDGSVVLEEKPESIEAHGAVVTPKRLADLVVERTLRPLLDRSRPEEVRVADICCGAGNFLVSAYDLLLNEALLRCVQTRKSTSDAERRGDVFQSGGAWVLSFRRRREILSRCIFGVDIDPLAVEISKFSLLLKLLDGVSPAEIESFRAETGERPLPNLDANIRNGNSLVGTDFFQNTRRTHPNHALIRKIRPFDFAEEFGRGTFSAIVGNPPYVRVQNLVKYSEEEYSYFKSGRSGYETARSATLDKYELFVERMLSLLEPDGFAGCLVPHKFMTNRDGKNLRALLSRNGVVRGFVHFGTTQIFKGRTTYPCALFLGKGPEKDFFAQFIRGDSDLGRLFISRDLPHREFPVASLSETPWVFPEEEDVRTDEMASRHFRPLSDFADVFVGLQTSANSIFLFRGEDIGGGRVRGKDKTGQSFEIESTILRPCLYKESLSAYTEPHPSRYLLFPYASDSTDSVLIPPDEMERRYPLAWEYLNRFKTELSQRDIVGGAAWYAFGRSQSIGRFAGGEHLVWAVLSRNASYAYDTRCTAFTGGGNGPYYGLAVKPGVEESILYLLALLQHGPAERWIESRSSHFRGDYYSHSKQFMESIPIVPVDFSIATERRSHGAIVASVRRILKWQKELDGVVSSSDRSAIQRLVAAEKKRLASLVAARYKGGRGRKGRRQ